MPLSVPNAGDLKERANFFSLSQEPSALSSMSDFENEFVLEPLYSLWCKLETVGFQLYFESSQNVNSVTHRIWLRKINGKSDIQTLSNHNLRIKIKNIFYKVVRVQELKDFFVMAEIKAIEIHPELLND